MTTTESPASKRQKTKDSWLSRHTVAELLHKKHQKNPKKHLVTFDHDETVGSALKGLARHHILSAPILLAPSTEDDDQGTYLGMVGVNELMKHVITQIASEAKDKTGKEKWKSLEDSGAKFLQTRLLVIAGEDNEFAFPGFRERSVHDLLVEGFFRHPDQPAHRVTISDFNGELQDVVSQSDVIHFACENLDASLGPLGSRTINELGLIKNHPVEVVSENIPAIEAFEIMYNKKVSSLGLVDPDGKLVGNVSASDVRGIQPHGFSLLTLPVLRFVYVEKFNLLDADQKASVHEKALQESEAVIEAAKHQAQEKQDGKQDEKDGEHKHHHHHHHHHEHKEGHKEEHKDGHKEHKEGHKEHKDGHKEEHKDGHKEEHKDEHKDGHKQQSSSEEKKADVFAVTGSHTLRDIVLGVRDKRVHRVYVVDSMESMRPLGIITLTDILQLLQNA